MSTKMAVTDKKIIEIVQWVREQWRKVMTEYKKNTQEYTEGYKGSGSSADVKKPKVITSYPKKNGVVGVDVLELRDALEGLYNAVDARFNSPSHEKIRAIAAAHGVKYTGPLVYESMNIAEDVLCKTKCLAK